jgi:asparagine synthetase B (glutamine-hydrolysing)
MCGIFGLVSFDNKQKNIKEIIKKLSIYSQTRGLEASGAVFSSKTNINYIKKSKQISKLIKDSVFKTNQDLLIDDITNNKYGVYLGHTRLKTNGDDNNNNNNQPIIKDDSIIIHNGIVLNESELYKDIQENIDNNTIDTKSIISYINYQRKTLSNQQSIINTYKKIQGIANIATMYANSLDIILSTNNSSLYYTYNHITKTTIFASEYIILKKLNLKDFTKIKQLQINENLYISYLDKSIHIFSNTQNTSIKENKLSTKRNIQNLSQNIQKNKSINIHTNDYSKFDKIFLKNKDKIDKIKRCNKCILPSTMPFITFDRDGVCNYCNNYTKLKPKGKEALLKQIKTYKNQSKCLVTFSGGRDSSYALHYIKQELGLNPIAYTYDWGVITDIGRRNQSRMCQKLGIEHIIVSANITKKRQYIKQNIQAWLKKPYLGMIPLFMAGDKQYFYYANKVAKDNNIDLIFMNCVAIEKTSFKAGFCNIKPNFSHNDGIVKLQNNKSQIQLLMYYIKQYISNTNYINTSLLDTISAFISYYMIKQDYLRFFQYIKWDEKNIDNILKNTYQWETLPQHNTTWRIGDGTSHFYNYLYYSISALSENDTFRSNQIREGMITRKEALEIIQRDNIPRWNEIKDYCEMINLDFFDTINKINNIKKIY